MTRSWRQLRSRSEPALIAAIGLDPAARASVCITTRKGP